MADELTPETPEEEQPKKTHKQRKNGLYPGVSDELAESMRTGWADTELHGLEPIAQAGHTADRRAALSARFPGERLVVPAGRLKTRSNDTEYPFRASTEYAYLTGDQTENGVLVLEPTGAAGHTATIYLLPRSDRENGEFWLSGQGELWVGRRHSLTEAEQLLGIPASDVRELAGALTEAEGPVRCVRGHDSVIESALTDKVTKERDEELRVYLSEARAVKDDFEIGELQKAVDSTVRGFEDVVKVLDKAEATSERYIEGTFFLRARVEGNDVGYGSICAAGPHACTLHWVRNDGDVRSGDLLLLDAGVETHSSTPPTSRARCRSTARTPTSSARSTTRSTRPRKPASPRSSRVRSSATSTTPRSTCWPRSSSSGVCWRARSSASWSWACSAAGPCTAPATCSAWTSTTAPRRAPRRTSTAPWSRACASPSSRVSTSRPTT